MMEDIKAGSRERAIYLSIVTRKCAMDIRAADLLVLKESIRSWLSFAFLLFVLATANVGLFLSIFFAEQDREADMEELSLPVCSFTCVVYLSLLFQLPPAVVRSIQ